MPTLQMSTDHQIQTAIVKQLDWSPDVESEHVGVAVTDGTVTLSGEVRTLAEKRAAVKSALRIHCVVALVDDIAVRSPAGVYRDVDVAREVADALSRHVQLTGTTIHATVHDQTVTLTGTVDWNYQREAAHLAVESLPGVRDVLDRIAVRTVPTTASTESDIRAALARAASAEARRIDVAVSGHSVTLQGCVQSWTERYRVEQAAWSAPGITHVVNDLTVAP